ncbi:hypothetical protein Daus18300_002365 [Diaporthe australafricana]|uniref:Heterokaryon incompatibility domain-containing protein n=1 Tax=Diaporthe australafricana TaxID=127596 RepID=A0ABR3XPW4_9PEZI
MSQARSILHLGNYDYDLVPVEYNGHHTPKLRKFDDTQLGIIEEFKYTPLERSRKMIRLLQLKSGPKDAPDIYCELVQADYDNRYHIPTFIDDSNQGRESDRSRNHTNKYIDEESKLRAELDELESLESREIKYQALSWCWGKDVADYAVLITEKKENKEKIYKMKVREQLALALKYLRHRDKARTLWIDAICINQNDPSERNHQVQMMSRIYTRAEEVCIWLGDGDSSSSLAINFISDDITNMRKFDAMFNDGAYTEKWKALMTLMQREWFSRRWVVQEIALARQATIHCGSQSMPWKEFAAAVRLFVEIESTTHRLSQIMRKHQRGPGWFEHVSFLGASLLVEATEKVFRPQTFPSRGSHGLRELNMMSLLSLEYLVSTLSVFGATEPRDAIYSMLALARDATPSAISSPDYMQEAHDEKNRLITMVCQMLSESKPFMVDYRRPYTDVCKDFINFAIERRRRLHPSQALDILCRPWALPIKDESSTRMPHESRKRKVDWLIPPRDTRERPWKRRKPNTSGVGNDEDEGNDNLVQDDKSMLEYWKFCEHEWSSNTWGHQKVSTRPQATPRPWKVDEGFPKRMSQLKDSGNHAKAERADDMPLPSWVAQVSKAPIQLGFKPGIEPQIAGRSNADPLVGYPQDGKSIHNASWTQARGRFKFRKRPVFNHYSLFVNGFVLEEVEEVMEASQGGNIPKSWLDLAQWTDYAMEPPGEFWRTLVADRGRDNREAPSYYSRACSESAVRGGLFSGRIDTTALIEHEQNFMVVEFCRRVHAVIWNRRLFKTASGRLGLASNVEKGDKVCILYGCSVPVVIHENKKNKGDSARERQDDCLESLRRVMKRMEQRRERRGQYQRRVREEFTNEYVAMITEQTKRFNYWHQSKSEQPTDWKSYYEDVDSHYSQEDIDARPREEGQQEQAVMKGEGQSDCSGQISLPSLFRKFQAQRYAAKEPDRENWYEFRGECYLHGMMDGEAISEKYHKRIVERTFELR